MVYDSVEDFAKSDAFRALPRKRTGAGLVIVDEQMRVLLVELGESPRDAARREGREELGFTI